MPEGPECRIIVEGLRKNIVGHTLTKIDIIAGRYLKKSKPAGWEQALDLLPARIDAVNVKGKFIFWTLTSGDITFYMWNTLGMSGVWFKTNGRDARICFVTSNGDFFFTDQRNFGTLKFVFSERQTLLKLQSLGIDMLNDDPSIEDFKKLLKLRRNKNKTLPEFLMNQANCAGVGNYIKSELLYRAKLSPHRNLENLNDNEVQALFEQIKYVMRASYAAHGASMTNYRDINECGGHFEKIVYKKQTDPQGNYVISEETKDHRTTHWVPNVQL